MKLELPHDPQISPLGIYSKELKTGTQTHAHSTIHNSQKAETTQIFINGSTDQRINTL